jgi:hypothetical protein
MLIRLIRVRLTALVVAVIVGALTGLVGTPMAICGINVSAAAGSPVEIVCTCGHGVGAQCPMHPHHQTGKETKSTTHRWCAGCHDSVEMTLTAMIGFAAPIVDRQQLIAPDGTSIAVHTHSQLPLDGVHPPIAPPPRG